MLLPVRPKRHLPHQLRPAILSIGGCGTFHERISPLLAQKDRPPFDRLLLQVHWVYAGGAREAHPLHIRSQGLGKHDAVQHEVGRAVRWVGVDVTTPIVSRGQVKDDVLVLDSASRDVTLAQIAEKELHALDACGEVLKVSARQVVGNPHTGPNGDEPIDKVASNE